MKIAAMAPALYKNAMRLFCRFSEAHRPPYPNMPGLNGNFRTLLDMICCGNNCPVPVFLLSAQTSTDEEQVHFQFFSSNGRFLVTADGATHCGYAVEQVEQDAAFMLQHFGHYSPFPYGFFVYVVNGRAQSLLLPRAQSLRAKPVAIHLLQSAGTELDDVLSGSLVSEDTYGMSAMLLSQLLKEQKLRRIDKEVIANGQLLSYLIERPEDNIGSAVVWDGPATCGMLPGQQFISKPNKANGIALRHPIEDPTSYLQKIDLTPALRKSELALKYGRTVILGQATD